MLRSREGFRRLDNIYLFKCCLQYLPAFVLIYLSTAFSFWFFDENKRLQVSCMFYILALLHEFLLSFRCKLTYSTTISVSKLMLRWYGRNFFPDSIFFVGYCSCFDIFNLFLIKLTSSKLNNLRIMTFLHVQTFPSHSSSFLPLNPTQCCTKLLACLARFNFIY